MKASSEKKLSKRLEEKHLYYLKDYLKYNRLGNIRKNPLPKIQIELIKKRIEELEEKRKKSAREWSCSPFWRLGGFLVNKKGIAEEDDLYYKKILEEGVDLMEKIGKADIEKETGNIRILGEYLDGRYDEIKEGSNERKISSI